MGFTHKLGDFFLREDESKISRVYGLSNRECFEFDEELRLLDLVYLLIT